MTVHALKSWLRHRFMAKGRHGVHSPFVYRFVEEVLRGKGSFEEKLRVFSDREQLKPVRYETIPAALPAHETHTIIIFPRIHATAATTAAWEALAILPEVRLSLDLYHAGLLLFHTDFTVKQHFLLQ